MQSSRSIAAAVLAAATTLLGSSSTARAASIGEPIRFTLNGTSVVAPVPSISLDVIDAPPKDALPSPPERCPAEPLDPVVGLPWPMSIVLAVGEVPDFTGSASIGTPQDGALWSGVELLDTDDIGRAGAFRWGTASAVRSIERAAREVRRCHPDSSRVMVGDLSRQHGGELEPHHSHQSGLDADIAYFHASSGPAAPPRGDGRLGRAFRDELRWGPAARTLDVERTWTLIRALIEGGNVEAIFMDTSVQRRLRAYAATLGPRDRAAFEAFERPYAEGGPLLRHEPGHTRHFHVRFSDPAATKLGQRLVRAWPDVVKTRG
jgi:murein endopeptidase